MIVIIVFVLCGVCVDGLREGDSCYKRGDAGVCVNIRLCPDAQNDVKNKQIPQLCHFSAVDPIVCCISVKTTAERLQPGMCVLPPYPRYGFYFSNVPDSKPGDAYNIFVINVTCIHGYDVDGPRSILCQNGWWQQQMPKCVPLCHLVPDHSIEYSCLVSEGGVNGSRPCREYEPQGTVVSPQCQYPNYYSPTALEPMRCVDGAWDYYAKCVRVCGKVTAAGEPLSVGGRPGTRYELPWRADIYVKKSASYALYCGGSLISTSAVISAAHCFWVNSTMGQVGNYAVAVGKVYPVWGHPGDAEASQRADVAKIHIPIRYQGIVANFRDDIALAVTTVAFKLTTYIRPVCLDFDYNFDKRQLQPGNKGKAAGWVGFQGAFEEMNKTDDGPPQLNVFDFSYVDTETCIKEVPANYRDLISSDKFCASEKNSGSQLCIGDDGGGLVFLASDMDVPRYYLRGVFSIAPPTEKDEYCIKDAHMLFTRILSHENFIKQFWKENIKA